jgi:hypothetical protein
MESVCFERLFLEVFPLVKLTASAAIGGADS